MKDNEAEIKEKHPSWFKRWSALTERDITSDASRLREIEQGGIAGDICRDV